MKIAEFMSYFEGLEDPRIERSKRHLLQDIILIAVLSFIAGAQCWTEIEDYGHENEGWLKNYLKLPNGIPSHDTFARVFARLNPKAFQDSFIAVMQAFGEETEGEIIALDGKTLRRSHNRREGKRPLHLVSAWASRNGLTLGQVKTADKSNEIKAFEALLELVDVKGCTVTIDAMGCQRKIAAQIKEAKGDYVLAVKANQGQLQTKLIGLFKQAKELNYEAMVYSKTHTVDGEHGRIETRNYTVLPLMYAFEYKRDWKGLQAFVKVESIREKGDRLSVENRYYISSLKPEAPLLAEAIRRHWSIENSLHWCLDVVFNEDQSRIRKGHAPENVALLRRMVLSLLKAETSFKAGLRRKQRKALTDKNYLFKVLSAKGI